VKGDEKRLIKIVLNGLTGPIDVAGEKYGAGTQSVPMPGMGGMSNEEIALVDRLLHKTTPPMSRLRRLARRSP
jgi:hypothetical protein